MHDLVIRGGSLIDGTGAPAQAGDIAIDQGRISRIGDLAGATAAEQIDASTTAAALLAVCRWLIAAAARPEVA